MKKELFIKPKGSIKCNNAEIGESIEETMRRAVCNGEPIESSMPMIYTDKKDGVRQDTDIRTDRWDVANEGADKITKTNRAKREAQIAAENEKIAKGATPED